MKIVKTKWWKGIITFLLTTIAVIAIGFVIEYFTRGF